jgi:hypothetical protein
MELLHEFQRLVALRRERPALRRGEFRFLWASSEVVAYARWTGDQSIVVALNVSRHAQRLDLPLGNLAADESVWEEVWTHDAVCAEQGVLRDLALSPRSGRVFATPS